MEKMSKLSPPDRAEAAAWSRGMSSLACRTMATAASDSGPTNTKKTPRVMAAAESPGRSRRESRA